jgi:hypothetical protein
MNDIILSAIIVGGSTIIGALIGAVIQARLPTNDLTLWLTRTPKRKRILGTWNSYWGPTPDKVREYNEVITITRQKGERVWGKAIRLNEPSKTWDIEGRVEGEFLQMLYFPAKESTNTDFLDYGCYILKKQASGKFTGFSTGFGPSETTGEDSLSTDCHEMVRRK